MRPGPLRHNTRPDGRICSPSHPGVAGEKRICQIAPSVVRGTAPQQGQCPPPARPGGVPDSLPRPCNVQVQPTLNVSSTRPAPYRHHQRVTVARQMFTRRYLLLPVWLRKRAGCTHHTSATLCTRGQTKGDNESCSVWLWEPERVAVVRKHRARRGTANRMGDDGTVVVARRKRRRTAGFGCVRHEKPSKSSGAKVLDRTQEHVPFIVLQESRVVLGAELGTSVGKPGNWPRRGRGTPPPWPAGRSAGHGKRISTAGVHPHICMVVGRGGEEKGRVRYRSLA